MPIVKEKIALVNLPEDALYKFPAELSGGMKKRVAIARALINNPCLVFGDEPTGNLDKATGQLIMDIFKMLNEQGVTVILVTHEPTIAATAKRIIEIVDGTITRDEKQ